MRRYSRNNRYRRTRKRTYRRRFNRYKKRQYTGSSIKSRQLIIPDNAYIKLRWSRISNNTTPIFTKFVLANGLWQPGITDFSDVTSPAGMIQWTNFYQSYIVYASSCRFTITNLSDANSLYVGMYPTSDLAAVTAIESVADQPYSKTKLLGCAQGTSTVTLSQFMTSKKMLNYKDLADADKCIGTLGSDELDLSNPELLWHWKFIATAPPGETAEYNYSYEIRITYYVQLREREAMDQVEIE